MSTIRFFTHHKCATKWLGSVLEHYARIQHIRYYYTHYSAKFSEIDEGIQLYANADYRVIPESMRAGVHVIRNPLDLLVSSYFSHLRSHSLDGWPELAEHRRVLQATGKRMGLYADWIFVERADFYSGAIGPLSAMRIWDYRDQRFINMRMEDLVEDSSTLLIDAFAHFGFATNLSALEEALQLNSFSTLANGRSRGEEKSDSHYRKGLPDDWMNHLDDQQIALVRLVYKDILARYYPKCMKM